MIDGASLLNRPVWVFDMDGTLTVPMHDFASFKADNGLPSDQDVLGATLALPEPRRTQVLNAIAAWEDELARSAQPQDDAVALLEAITGRGGRVGVLTRNSKVGALVTLGASGLDRFFDDAAFVLGRDCAPAKPAPDGVQLLLSRFGAQPEEAVMVGDWVFDIQAGRNAGTATVLVERHGPAPEEWHPLADAVVGRLDELLTP